MNTFIKEFYHLYIPCDEKSAQTQTQQNIKPNNSVLSCPTETLRLKQ